VDEIFVFTQEGAGKEGREEERRKYRWRCEDGETCLREEGKDKGVL